MKYRENDLFDTAEKRQTIAERIMQYGVKGLCDCEPIEELIRPYISSKINMTSLVKTIADAMNSNLLLTLEDLTAIKGVSEEIATGLLIALELGRRKGEKRKKSISSPSDIYEQVKHFADEESETFVVMALNGAYEIIYTKSVSRGLINRTIVHPREVFSDAIKERAVAIALIHNHPSGNVEPSADDKNVTKRLQAAGELIGIKILDHLIISEEGYFSFMEHGLM